MGHSWMPVSTRSTTRGSGSRRRSSCSWAAKSKCAWTTRRACRPPICCGRTVATKRSSARWALPTGPRRGGVAPLRCRRTTCGTPPFRRCRRCRRHAGRSPAASPTSGSTGEPGGCGPNGGPRLHPASRRVLVCAGPMASHPFLDSTFHIRWSHLAPEQIVPDIGAGLARAEAALAAIETRELADLTYENTFLALEKATEELSMAWTKVTHLQSIADAPALREAHNAMLPKISAFFAKIPLNAGLWLRLRTVAESPAGRALTGITPRRVGGAVGGVALGCGG